MFYGFCLAQQILVYQSFAFPSPFQYLPSFLCKSQTTTLNFLSVFSCDGIEGEDFGQFGELFRSPQSLSCTHVIKLLFDFLSFICFMSILFLD